MKKRVNVFIFVCYILGLMAISFSLLFRSQLSDFALGFCEGISIVFIIVGIFYMGWCIRKKENPFKIEDDKEKEN